MKKYLLFIFAVLLSMSATAQTYDETLLDGKWTLSSTTGNGVFSPLIKSISVLDLGADIRTDEGGYQEIRGGEIIFIPAYNAGSEGLPNGQDYILDYFISNNDKLHLLIGDDFHVHARITELTATTLSIQNYAGTLTLTFSKTPASVNAASAAKANEDRTYNLSGQQVSAPSAPGVYVEQGKKYLLK